MRNARDVLLAAAIVGLLLAAVLAYAQALDPAAEVDTMGEVLLTLDRVPRVDPADGETYWYDVVDLEIRLSGGRVVRGQQIVAKAADQVPVDAPLRVWVQLDDDRPPYAAQMVEWSTDSRRLFVSGPGFGVP